MITMMKKGQKSPNRPLLGHVIIGLVIHNKSWLLYNLHFLALLACCSSSKNQIWPLDNSLKGIVDWIPLLDSYKGGWLGTTITLEG